MDVQAEKYKLIEWITSLNDVSIINQLMSVKDKESKKDWWNELSNEEIYGINQGIKDAENGKIYPHEEIMKSFKNKVGL